MRRHGAVRSETEPGGDEEVKEQTGEQAEWQDLEGAAEHRFRIPSQSAQRVFRPLVLR